MPAVATERDKRLLAKLRHPPRIGARAHVDHRGDGVLVEEAEESLERMVRMTDGVDRGAFAWTGPLDMSTDAGFEIVHADPPTKPLVRRSLRPGRKRG